MGITAFDIKILGKYIDLYKPKNVIELGSQNLYLTNENIPPFASKWYVDKGLKYQCIDLGGDNGAWKIDLAHQFGNDKKGGYPLEFDLVTDFGTSEHCVKMEHYDSLTYENGVTSIYPKGEINIEEGYYNCWLNKHNLCKIGGLVISENPMTGMWNKHGYTFLGKDFYEEFVKISGYELLEDGVEGATGNWITGVNVYGVIKKISDKFPDFETFNTLSIYKS